MHLSKTSSTVFATRAVSVTSVVRSATLIAASSCLLLACGDPERKAENETDDIPGAILIDNGEDGNNTTLENEIGFIGFWYTFDDRCDCENTDPTGETTPNPEPTGGGQFTMSAYGEGLPAAPTEGTQKANKYGMRVRGGGHNLFGAGVGVGLNNQSGSLFGFDLTAQGFTGLRFQARSGVPGETLDLKVRISDGNSEPAGGQCAERPENQDQCDPTWDGTSCEKQGCFDSATTTISVSNEWQTYEIPFSQLQRENWGAYVDGVMPPALTLDAADAYQVQFAVFQGLTQFDLWLDNVGFVAGG